MQQVLIAFRFYTTGTFEEVIGDLFGVSVFATCTVIQKVSRAIAKRPKRNEHILSFPEQLANTERDFYKIVGTLSIDNETDDRRRGFPTEAEWPEGFVFGWENEV